MLWLEIKYAGLLSSALKKYKVKSNVPFLANFRCILCGDSAKSKIKARGYFYQDDTRLWFRCHNCGASSSFEFFLKKVNPQLHDEYIKEKFLAPEKKEETFTQQKPEFVYPDHLRAGEPLTKLKKISQLVWNHPVKEYILKRKIPNVYHSKLFYAPKFNAWVNTMIPKMLDEKRDEPRLVIPFFDEKVAFFGFQGRAFSKKSLRYITIMLKKDATKIYGLDTVDKSKKVYVLEGPIDSMFISNSIAMAGSDIHLPEGFNDVTYVLDNEPRNIEIVKRLVKYVESGYNVCFWPSNIKEKDVNDMIMSGMDSEDILSMINQNTFSGLLAQMKLAEWRKV